MFGISWTFLVVDWLMVLDYTWFSTMWGVYLFAGSALSSMAMMPWLVVSLIIGSPYFSEMILTLLMMTGVVGTF